MAHQAPAPENKSVQREIFAFYCQHDPGHRFRTKEGLTFEVVRPLTTQEVCRVNRRLYDLVARAIPNGEPIHWSECILAQASEDSGQPVK